MSPRNEWPAARIVRAVAPPSPTLAHQRCLTTQPCGDEVVDRSPCGPAFAPCDPAWGRHCEAVLRCVRHLLGVAQATAQATAHGPGRVKPSDEARPQPQHRCLPRWAVGRRCAARHDSCCVHLQGASGVNNRNGCSIHNVTYVMCYVESWACRYPDKARKETVTTHWGIISDTTDHTCRPESCEKSSSMLPCVWGVANGVAGSAESPSR